MKIAALLVAVLIVFIGLLGIASPDLLTAARREYFATPIGLYSVGALRMTMAIVVILVAPISRAPKTLRVLGAMMCLQALSAMLLGPERAGAILEWEAMQRTPLLRAGAAGALAAGVFVAFAVTGRGGRAGGV